jgi:electron transfer flavoprotein alpha subunit
MADILVHVEVQGGVPQSVSLELLTAARTLAGATGGSVEALVIGGDVKAIAARLGAADRVVFVSDRALDRYTPEAHASVLVDVVRSRNPALVLIAYSSVGIDLAPQLAWKSERPLIAYCARLAVSDDTVEATSLMHSGTLNAVSRAPLPAVVAVVPGAFPEAEDDGRLPELVEIAPPASLASLRTTFVSETLPVDCAVDLTRADRIVCVGRGIKDKDSIDIARQVAAALGAEIAGSRPVIDNGWLPKERQVGKSGRKVKPKLYLAVGVSGAPEHLEGMSGAELIVAVNSDAKAPIFGVAHYGTTCDLFDLLPALEERLAARRGA